MRQGYIDSQGNKYILTGVKAQFPKWTYAEWQAEGEPDIPWIRTDAPSGYRKVSASDTSYDNTSSGLTATNTQVAIDEIKGDIDSEIGGKAVYLGGVKSSEISTSSLTEIIVPDLSQYKLLRFFTSYYKQNPGPDYGGETLSVALFRRYNFEALKVANYGNTFRFVVRYKSDTKIEVMFESGTQADTNCLQMWAIL